MKVLYLGHYKEGSGWSNAAINNILALDSVGIDIVCRDVKLTNNQPNVPSRILELESKDLNNVDYCIQHVLPHHLTFTDKFKKNIAYFAHETSSIKHNSWYTCLSLMDSIWIPSSLAKESLKEDGIIENKIKVVPHCFEIYNYQTDYPKINFQDLNHTFKFYTIADLNDRKNLDDIIKCYYSEFTSSDQVCLVIKVKQYGMNKNTLSEVILKKIDNIKSTLRIHKNKNSYPKQVIISSDMSNKEIYSLHSSCDCFIGTSRGEGWSIPAFEAMCFGKTPICSNEGGPRDFIDKDDVSTGKLINGVYDICYHSNPAFDTIFTGNEYWFHPSHKEIKMAMRFYYENRGSINRTNGIKRAKQYTFENIGNTMKGLLDG